MALEYHFRVFKLSVLSKGCKIIIAISPKYYTANVLDIRIELYVVFLNFYFYFDSYQPHWLNLFLAYKLKLQKINSELVYAKDC